MLENYLEFFLDFLSSLPNILFALSDIDKAISIGLLSSIFVTFFLILRTSRKKKLRYTRSTATSFVREKENEKEEELRPNEVKDSEGISEPKILDIPEKSVSEIGTRARESSEFIRDTNTSFIRGEYKDEKSHVEKPKILKSKLESKKDDSLQGEPFHPDDLKNSEDLVHEQKILAVPEYWRIPEKSQEESENGVGRVSPFRVNARQKIPYLELDPRVEKDIFSTIAGFTVLFDEKPLKVHQNWARFRSSYGVSVLNNLPEMMKYSTPNCHSCGKRGDDNQRCSICGNYYCVDHVGPESHGCPKIAERIWTNHRLCHKLALDSLS